MENIYPYWPAPKNIRALTTIRQGGVSLQPYQSMNLANHVGDDELAVITNRQQIILQEKVPSSLAWLIQTHSTEVIDISSLTAFDTPLHADASYSCSANVVSVVLTADCLPVLFCSSSGDQVAAAHAGWRGLCGGILENTVKHFDCPTSKIMAWLGPAIGPQAFEVGIEVKQAFTQHDAKANVAFQLSKPIEQKYLANLYLLAKQRLLQLGITQIYGGEYCTYQQSERFFSYRRDKQTGRMASMIWFT